MANGYKIYNKHLHNCKNRPIIIIVLLFALCIYKSISKYTI